MSEWDIKDLEVDTTGWVERMNKSCPFCGKQVEVDIEESNPQAASVQCECGYWGIVTPPDDISPLKGVIKEIRL